ncbi:MAG: hypothetical protein ACTSVV_07520 [Promethearchaeota archaeon]
MNENNEYYGYEDRLGDIAFLFQRKLPISLKIFFKDVEILKRSFIAITLILNSFTFLLLGQFWLDFYFASFSRNYILYSSIIFGLLLGMIISYIISDRIERPIKILKLLIIITLIISIIEYTLLQNSQYLILQAFLIINTSLIIFGFMLLFKLFLLQTTILERGRVWAYLACINAVFMIFLIFSLMFFNLIILPVIYCILTLFYLQKQTTKLKIISPKPSAFPSKKIFTSDSLKYYFFFTLFSITAGLATNLERSESVLSASVSGEITVIFLSIILFVIISSLIMGLGFDYGGRTTALSIIILTIAASIYFRLFEFEALDYSLAVIFAGYVASIMIIPLLVGDIYTKVTYGKALSLSYTLLGIGLTIGWLLRIQILEIFISDENYAYNILHGTIFMLCIGCLIVLITIRETLPRKEQDWKDFLLHLYIVHQSGILLYEYAFKEDEKNNHPDLVSGGLVGLKSMLKEIVHGEKEIRTIDHGDRKIIFKMNRTKDIIFALIVKEELIVLRRKLDALIEEFDHHYLDILKDIDELGLDLDLFKNVKYIVRKYFGY